TSSFTRNRRSKSLILEPLTVYFGVGLDFLEVSRFARAFVSFGIPLLFHLPGASSLFTFLPSCGSSRPITVSDQPAWTDPPGGCARKRGAGARVRRSRRRSCVSALCPAARGRC